MRRDLLAIAALTLAGPVRGVAAERAFPPARIAPAADDDGRTFADYQIELRRLVAAEEARGAASLPIPPAPPTSEQRCRLTQPGAGATTSADCVRCHGAAGRDNHPVDVDYEAVSIGRRADLRPLVEVVRRGLLLPEGRLRCVTCHDGLSRWNHRLALPPGARPAPAVNPRDPATHQASDRPFASLPPAGTAVGVKPLCTVCHQIGD